MSMSNGVAIVTGASQGIGRAIALRLAKDGFNIALNDLPTAKKNLDDLSKEIVGKTGRKVCVVMGDVAVEGDVRDVVVRVVDEFGGVDVMVANAGICFVSSMIDTTVDAWDHIFSINTRGVFLCYKYAAQQMIKQGRGGRIIGASSEAGQRGVEGVSAYSATKFAIRGLTQSAAEELGRFGITVNVYCPGPTETPMLEGLATGLGDREKYYQLWKEGTPMGYRGVPEDVANLVSFLASKEAHYITGQSMSVNGGRFFT